MCQVYEDGRISFNIDYTMNNGIHCHLDMTRTLAALSFYSGEAKCWAENEQNSAFSAWEVFSLSTPLLLEKSQLLHIQTNQGYVLDRYP